MKTITDVVKVVGLESHKGIDDLSQAVFNKCVSFSITKTRAGGDINIEVIDRTIRNILSNIKLGKGHWSAWSFRYGKNVIKLYNGNDVDVLHTKYKDILMKQYNNIPTIGVLIQPELEGIKADSFLKLFTSLSEASEYIMTEESASGLYLLVGDLLIALNMETE